MNKQRKTSKTKHSADSQNREGKRETKDPSCNFNTQSQAHTLISFSTPPNEIMSDIIANIARFFSGHVIVSENA